MHENRQFNFSVLHTFVFKYLETDCLEDAGKIGLNEAEATVSMLNITFTVLLFNANSSSCSSASGGMSPLYGASKESASENHELYSGKFP